MLSLLYGSTHHTWLLFHAQHPYLTTGKTVTLTMTYNYSMIQQLYFGYIFKGIDIRISKLYLHFHVHCKIFTIYKTWKQPKCLLPGEMIDTWWKLLSRVWLFATPWTVAYQAPPSMGFSRQEYWSGLPFPSPEYLPDPGIELESPAL